MKKQLAVVAGLMLMLAVPAFGKKCSFFHVGPCKVGSKKMPAPPIVYDHTATMESHLNIYDSELSEDGVFVGGCNFDGADADCSDSPGYMYYKLGGGKYMLDMPDWFSLGSRAVFLGELLYKDGTITNPAFDDSTPGNTFKYRLVSIKWPSESNGAMDEPEERVYLCTPALADSLNSGNPGDACTPYKLILNPDPETLKQQQSDARAQVLQQPVARTDFAAKLQLAAAVAHPEKKIWVVAAGTWLVVHIPGLTKDEWDKQVASAGFQQTLDALKKLGFTKYLNTNDKGLTFTQEIK